MQVCIECNKYVNDEVYDYSLNHFGHPLCRNHQDWIRKISSFIIEWNETCPLKDYQFNQPVSKDATLVDIKQQLRRLVEVYDFD